MSDSIPPAAAPPTSAPHLTVVLCTRNRAEGLVRTLEGLVTATASLRMPWELIVVDNGSTDDTQEAATRYAERLPLRVVVEPVAGLSAARNRGLAEAGGEWVIFTDDDVDAEPAWLAAYADALASAPEAAWCGGRILPRYPGGRPRWMKDERLDLIAGLLGHYDLGISTRPYVEDDPSPFGANFGLRRTTWERFGAFRTDLGVVGTEPGRGEETEYLGRVRAAGEPGVYVGEALLHHRLPEGRFGLRGLYRWGRYVGRSQVRQGNPLAGSRRRACMFLVKGLVQQLKGRGDRMRQCVINAGIQMGSREARKDADRE